MRGLPIGRPASLFHGVPLQTFHQIYAFLLCVWNSFHSHLVREEMFIGFRGLAKPCSMDKPRICSTLPDSVSNLFHSGTRLHGTELPPRTSSPPLGTVSQNNLRTLSSCCLLRGTFPATIQRVTSMGCHFDRETCVQLEPQASNLTFHYVWCSPNCTDALTAEFLCCLNLELDSICACPECDLVCQQLQRGFWINFQNCFRTRHPLDECSAHR